MSGSPLISVIMSAYNSAAYITEAIESLLAQTYRNFELIIVNDGSTDDTGNIISRFQDKRIIYLVNDRNMGNHYSRNRAMEAAKGEYIAIMDSDDIALPHRLQTQLKYFGSHPAIMLCGSAIQTFGISQPQKEYFPGHTAYIQAWLLFKNCFAHSTVMFRRELYDKGLYYYSNEIGPGLGEDHELWGRLADAGIKMSNLKQVLLKYRISPNQLSSKNIEERQAALKGIFFHRIRIRFGLEYDSEGSELIYAFIANRIEVDNDSFQLLDHFFRQLCRLNRHKHLYEEKAFRAVLWFFFLRIGKYYFLEYGKKPLLFLKYIRGVIKVCGLSSLYLFWKTDRRRWLS